MSKVRLCFLLFMLAMLGAASAAFSQCSNIVIVTATPDSVLYKGAETSAIRVEVKDGSGFPVPYTSVTFSISGLKMDNTAMTSPGSVNPTSTTTNSSGVAETTYTSGDDYGYVTITANAAGTSGSCQVKSNCIYLREVTFWPNSSNMYTVIRDSYDLALGWRYDPYYRTNKPLGEPNANETKNPICVTRATAVKAWPVFRLVPGMTSFTGTLRMKGINPDGYNFGGSNGFAAKFESFFSEIFPDPNQPVVCDRSFDDAVYFIRELPITWKLSRDNGVSWSDIGVSKNDVFIVRGNPVGGSPAYCSTLYRSVAYLATKNRCSSISDSEITVRTWDAFSGLSVKTYSFVHDDYVRPLYYYNRYDGHGHQDTSGMLNNFYLDTQTGEKYGDGQCMAWADILKECLRVNNIDAVRAKVAPPDGANGFVVKNSSTTGSPQYPDYYPWEWGGNNILFTPAGIPGQNMGDPAQKEFPAHWIVHVKSSEVSPSYYDPSYGLAYTDPVSSINSNINFWYRRHPDVLEYELQYRTPGDGLSVQSPVDE